MNSLTLDSLLQKLPYLKYLIDTHGDTSLFDYARSHYKVSPDENTLFIERKKEFLEILRKYVSWIFHQGMADTIVESLSKNYAVSTAEHHGPMGHPFFWQSTILRGIVNPSEAIINLCTSHVSLSNSSYPRGLVFHGNGVNAPYSYLHIPFFWANKRMSPVFGLSGYTREDIRHHAFPRIDAYLRDKMITEQQYAQIQLFLNDFVLKQDILERKTYSEQITLLNHIWWSHIFPDLPQFIPLGVEELVRQILIDHLGRNTIITELLTNTEIQPFLEEYFDGISCCFERKSSRWTYLFWHLDEENNRHALWREDDTLATVGKNFSIQLRTSSLAENLALWRLIPSWMLVYTVLSCYYQLTCFGGVFQHEYLAKISEGFLKIFPHEKLEKLTKTNTINADLYFIFGNQKRASTFFDAKKFTKYKLLLKAQNISLKEALLNFSQDL